ncbi:hypothetical protein ACIHFE_08655 [Streptomyces sp. NPDC052396]|uniref:hypothetical protein n=1 Tax=Streptomyces sp. NPDC052396 TaxID=3365689 RepID=UPI0037D804D9
MAEPRLIRVMADYDCHPLWVPDFPEYNVSPDDPRLSLSPELAQRLDRWALEYDGILVRDDPASSAFPSEEAERAFIATGKALARQLARERGPAWRVTYFDETRAHRDITPA